MNFFLLLNIRDFEVPLHQKQNKSNFKNIVKKNAHQCPTYKFHFLITQPLNKQKIYFLSARFCTKYNFFSFEMVKFLPKTCRLKNEKHEFVNVGSKAESSKKSYGSFEGEHVLQQGAQTKVAESCRCGICGRLKLIKM